MQEQNIKPLKVLVVDDSPMMCKAIEQILNEDERLQVASKALSGKEALRELSSKEFDVCTLDVHMPGMSGLSVLKNIMIKYPLPTLMVSAFTSEGSRVTFEALRFGAVDFFKKPTRDGDAELKEQAENLRNTLKRAARVQVQAARYLRIKPQRTKKVDKKNIQVEFSSISIIYGTTGSYSSILSIVPFINSPINGPIFISLGTTKENLKSFVEYLDTYSPLSLSLLEGRKSIQNQGIYFIPRDFSIHFDREGGEWIATVEKRPLNTKGEGAIDLTLLSASESFGEGVLSIFVSSDDEEGITGAKEVLRNKGKVIAQTPKTCLLPNGPEKVIRKLGAKGLEPIDIAKMINSWSL